MGNLLETPSLLPGLFGEEQEGDTVRFNMGTGWSSGFELLLRRRGSWFGYGLSVARRTFDSTSFYPVFDARHNFNVALTVGLGRNWQLNLQWVFRTGFPYTGPIGLYQHVEPGSWSMPDSFVPYYPWLNINGRRGNTRFPPFHRLDLGFDKRIRLFGMDATLYLQVINVYAAQNVLWYEYESYSGFEGETRVVRKPFVLLPIPIPSLGLRGSF